MAKLNPFESYQILGVRVDAATISGSVEAITDYVADSDSPAIYVTKPYVEFIDLAYSDPSVRQLLNAADLSLPDGVALQWAASFLNSGRRHWWQVITSGLGVIFNPASVTHPLPERISGINFTWPLLEACQAKKLRVFLVGRPKGGEIRDTEKAIADRLPSIQLCGSFDGYQANRHEPELLREIKEAHADVILVGTGFPRQEKLMARLKTELEHGVLIGEGGTFDYQSFGGHRPRAPRFIQKIGLEWLWRLVLEPWRIKRQLAIPRFVWRVWRTSNNQT